MSEEKLDVRKNLEKTCWNKSWTVSFPFVPFGELYFILTSLNNWSLQLKDLGFVNKKLCLKNILMSFKRPMLISDYILMKDAKLSVTLPHKKRKRW